MTAWPGERALHGGADRIFRTVTGGELWLCGKHFVSPDPEAALARTRTTTVVCLCEPHELAERYPDYIPWLRANRPQRALWHAVPDLHVPQEADADRLLSDLRRRLDAGERLLLHCGAGIGRSGTVATALLITTGVDPDAAAALVSAQRAMAGAESLVQVTFLARLARAGSAAAADPDIPAPPGLA